MLDAEIAQDTKDRLYLGAFIGFQMGAFGCDTFDKHLRKLGLADAEKPLDDKVRKIMAAKALEKADRIMRMDQGKK